MGLGRHALAVVPALPALGAAVIVAAVLRAAHRSDLPSFPNQDASGEFGDPSLPRLRIVCVGDSSLTGPGLETVDIDTDGFLETGDDLRVESWRSLNRNLFSAMFLEKIELAQSVKRECMFAVTASGIS